MTTADQHYLPPAPLGAPENSVAWAEWYRRLREVAESGQQALDNLDTTVYPALNDKLNRNAADVLGGTITFSTQGAFQVGNATYNGSTFTGTGVMFNNYGIVGVYNSSPKFVLKVDGTATFGGELSAATGTFAGSLSAATGTFAGSLSAASGTFSGTVQAGEFKTATTGKRITINESGNNKILSYDTAGNIIAEFGGSSAGGGYFPVGSLSTGPAVYAKTQSVVPAVQAESSSTGAGIQCSSTGGYGLNVQGGGAYIVGNATVRNVGNTATGTINTNITGALFDSNYYNWIQPHPTQGGTPTNSATPVGWLRILFNSNSYYIPIFQ